MAKMRFQGHIRQAKLSDVPRMQRRFDTLMGWQKRPGYFADVYQLQTQGQVVLLVAETPSGDYVGHLKIIWKPNYPHFRAQNIPEIQDLNVLPNHRRHGIATRLLDHAESMIQDVSAVSGIGFGLYADYGPAQRLYILRGYVPDGHGVTYRDQSVEPGSPVTLDDDLVLHLIKHL